MIRKLRGKTIVSDRGIPPNPELHNTGVHIDIRDGDTNASLKMNDDQLWLCAIKSRALTWLVLRTVGLRVQIGIKHHLLTTRVF